MKKIMLAVVSLGMAGSLTAFAQDQETTQYEPEEDVATESQRDNDRWTAEGQQDSPVATDYDKEKTHSDTRAGQQGQSDKHHSGMDKGLSKMTAKELEGKKVLTLSGEEVGEIDDVGTSATRQARVATVDVGGFLGIGEKTIAIPLSELQPAASDDGSVKTSMTRASIEALPEFDDSDFSEDDEDDGTY